MVCFLLLQLIYKNSFLYYKTVKIMIDALGFAEVIFNITVYHYGFLGPVITNSSTLYPLKTCPCYVIFYIVFLQRSICKPAALPKDQIVASKAYPLSF